MKVHSGDKPFGCSAAKGSLIKHDVMTVHCGDKPFGCSVTKIKSK